MPPHIRPQNVPACFGAQNTACVLESAEPVNLSALHLDANLSFMSAESAISHVSPAADLAQSPDGW